MNLADVTIEQLKAATKTQILTAISNRLSGLTKLQLCRLILRVADVDVDSLLTITDPPISTGDSRGPLLLIETERDLAGNKVKTKKIEHTYYPTREVDIITIKELDGSDIEISGKVIKHFTDGRQPIMTSVAKLGVGK